jgi:hypothetical protein
MCLEGNANDLVIEYKNKHKYWYVIRYEFSGGLIALMHICHTLRETFTVFRTRRITQSTI